MVPGQRTYPTVKPLATMNNKTLKSWEMRFGIVQSVFLIGLILGSIACSFLFGYYSGQRTGYENAMASNEATIARVPIHVSKPGLESDSGELYAQLKERSGAGLAKIPITAHSEKSGATKDADIPELGSVKTLEESPLVGSDQEDLVGKGLERANGEEMGAHNDSASDSAGDNNSVNNAIDSLLAAPQADSAGKGAGKNNDHNDTMALAIGAKSKSGAAAGETLGKLAAAHTDQQAGKIVQVDPDQAKELVESSKAITSLEEAHNKNKASQASLGKEQDGKKIIKSVEDVHPAVEKTTTSAALSASAAKPSNSPKILSGWFAQVAAPKRRSDADELSSKLKGSGFKVSIETASVRGEDYFRVLVGPEENRDQATRLVSQLKRERYLQGEPFVRMVK